MLELLKEEYEKTLEKALEQENCILFTKAAMLREEIGRQEKLEWYNQERRNFR